MGIVVMEDRLDVVMALHMFSEAEARLAAIPSPRFSGEREGPIAEQWEGEGLAASIFDNADTLVGK
ncbi:hypothetical protein [Taklimakanibacter lacteus]|uniref:hypothetical protein n=1 Tax=Taklimakanibacter lacteus TaxID=2268456 RepID=UPI0013C45904